MNTLARKETESVSVAGTNNLHQKIADVAKTHLEFPLRHKAHIFVSWLYPFKEQKLVVERVKIVLIWSSKELIKSKKVFDNLGRDMIKMAVLGESRIDEGPAS